VTSTANERRRSPQSQFDDRTGEITVGWQGSPKRRSRSWLIHRALAGADALALVASFAFAAAATGGNAHDRVALAGELIIVALSLPIWILSFKIKGLYDNDEDGADYSTIDDVSGVFVVVTVGVWLLYLFSSVTGLIAPSITRLGTFWLVALVVVPACRVIARKWVRSQVAYIQDVIVVGTGPVGRLFARKIVAHPEYGLRLVGFVDVDSKPGRTQIGDTPVLGSTAELADLVETLAIDRVIVSFTSDSVEETMDLVRSIRDQSVQIDIVPRLFELVGTNSKLHMVEGAPLVGLPPLRLSPSSRLLKRALDLTLSILGLVLVTPLLLVVAVAVKLDTPGPVFFRQVRRGEGSSTFKIFKFRSMVSDADGRKHEVAHLNMHASDDPRMFKVPNDPRTTRVGAFLRRWSIDEIPQLLNVVKGDMSLVGPRPLILAEDQYVVDWARKRLSIKPGVTGLWQVLGRSDIPFDEMTKLDYLYVTNWSLVQDLRLIALTIPALFRTRQAL
jgi:exopolysaccharide biosynthesis polyprenyl glycosylphosphotransferase